MQGQKTKHAHNALLTGIKKQTQQNKAKTNPKNNPQTPTTSFKQKTKQSKNSRTREENREDMRAYLYTTRNNIPAAKTRSAYQIWGERNPAFLPK